MTFHDFLGFSWRMLSSCFQSLLFEIFSHFMTHRMRAGTYFLLEVKPGLLTPLLFFQLLISLPFYSQKVYCLSMTFHDLHFNFMTSRPGKCNYKAP